MLSSSVSVENLIHVIVCPCRDTFTHPPCTLVQPAIEFTERVQQPFFGLGISELDL